MLLLMEEEVAHRFVQVVQRLVQAVHSFVPVAHRFAQVAGRLEIRAPVAVEDIELGLREVHE